MLNAVNGFLKRIKRIKKEKARKRESEKARLNWKWDLYPFQFQRDSKTATCLPSAQAGKLLNPAELDFSEGDFCDKKVNYAIL